MKMRRERAVGSAHRIKSTSPMRPRIPKLKGATVKSSSEIPFSLAALCLTRKTNFGLPMMKAMCSGCFPSELRSSTRGSNQRRSFSSPPWPSAYSAQCSTSAKGLPSFISHAPRSARASANLESTLKSLEKPLREENQGPVGGPGHFSKTSRCPREAAMCTASPEKPGLSKREPKSRGSSQNEFRHLSTVQRETF